MQCDRVSRMTYAVSWHVSREYCTNLINEADPLLAIVRSPPAALSAHYCVLRQLRPA